jgi:transketolase
MKKKKTITKKSTRITHKIKVEKPAKRNIERKYHFFPKDVSLNYNLFKKIEKNSTRQGFGEALLEIGERHKEVVVLTADLAESTRTKLFAEKYPERFFNTGIAEQNLIAVSSGLALSGKIPFAASFGVFITGRSWDHIRQSVCYSNANVKIVGTHSGVTIGADGNTQEALSDLAAMRTLPNIVVIEPCDYEQAKKATIAAAEYPGPVYLRLGRPNVPKVTTAETRFKIGKADCYVEGRDAAIIASGITVYEAILAAKKLKEHGVHARVVNMHTIKPIDHEEIIRCADTKLVVTVEDHSVIGGLGSAVAEELSQLRGDKPRMIMLGIKDVFGMSGDVDELMKEYQISSDDIFNTVMKGLNKH